MVHGGECKTDHPKLSADEQIRRTPQSKLLLRLRQFENSMITFSWQPRHLLDAALHTNTVEPCYRRSALMMSTAIINGMETGDAESEWKISWRAVRIGRSYREGDLSLVFTPPPPLVAFFANLHKISLNDLCAYVRFDATVVGINDARSHSN